MGFVLLSWALSLRIIYVSWIHGLYFHRDFTWIVEELHNSDMTLPQPSPDPGCAVNLDGSLKDASEIEWHFDKDSPGDETLLTVAEKSLSSASGPGPAVSEPESSQTLHPFFSGHAQAPAIFVAGSRRSGRTIRPSNRVVDPDNAMNSAPGPSKSKVTIGKRKAPSTQKSSRRVVQKTDYMVHTTTVHTSEDSNDDAIDDNSDNSDDDRDSDPGHMPSGPCRPSQPTHGKSTNIEATRSENVNSEQEYASLKAMADADHEVSITSSSTSKITQFTHLILRQSTESQKLMPLLMFAQSSVVIKSIRIQIPQRSRMDIGASFACKQINCK
jgi:hypothetical protein